jgi:1,4-dihydroxy-2-naphthoyl-CoA hydrolase
MPYIYYRTIHFQETDAAGVVYFANVLSICHEAYEESLSATGIEVRAFFGAAAIAVPITHAQVDFFRPLYCGDRIQLHLTPMLKTEAQFEITYDLYTDTVLCAQALTRHTCIETTHRQKTSLPPLLHQWLQQWSS